MRGREARLFWWTLPAVLLAALAGGALVALWVGSGVALRDFTAGEHGAAASSYRWQLALSRAGPERWKAPFNLGTAQLAGGALPEAAAALEDALAVVPRSPVGDSGQLRTDSAECRVRTNLSLARERLADAAAAAGDGVAAAALRESAREAMAPCSGGQADDRAPGGQQPSPGPDPGPTPSADPRVEELEERNRESDREAQERQRGEGGGAGSGQNW